MEKPSTLPFTPAVLSNSDFAKTFPFKKSDVKWKYRAKILKRTKHRKFWFSEAEELDKKRGTQLGTLGFLPWEIRQMIIELVFSMAYKDFSWWVAEYRLFTLKTLGSPPEKYFEDDFPSSWRNHPREFLPVVYLRDVSASTKVEVEYTFLTQTKFGFNSPDALKCFLGSLTKCQQSLLRSLTIELFDQRLCDKVKADNKAWMDACAQLPSGLTSIEFRFDLWSLDGWKRYKTGFTNKSYYDALGFLELLINRFRRCWAPRAKLGMSSSPCTLERDFAASVFDEVEDWSKEWLEWWESSQDGDQTEG